MSRFSQNTNVLLFTISVCMNADLHEIGQFVMVLTVLPQPDIIHINGVYKFYHCSQGLQYVAFM